MRLQPGHNRIRIQRHIIACKTVYPRQQRVLHIADKLRQPRHQIVKLVNQHRHDNQHQRQQQQQRENHHQH